MFHLGLLCRNMDALGLLALGISSGGAHGSFLFSVMGTKTYTLPSDNFGEIDRFDTGVTITGASLCYQLDASDYFSDIIKFDTSSSDRSFNIQTIPPASRYDAFKSIKIDTNSSVKFAYDGAYIVMYAYNDRGGTDATRGTFLAIVSY